MDMIQVKNCDNRFLPPKLKMSLVTNSPAHSSSSIDFAAFLDGELNGNSSDSLSEHEGGDELDPETERMKRRKIEEPCDLHVEASIKTNVCARGHVGSFGGLCFICWQIVGVHT